MIFPPVSTAWRLHWGLRGFKPVAFRCFSLLSMCIYLLVFIVWFILFISSCIVFWFWRVYILVHINCKHRIEIYFLQHIFYIVLCTKKKSLFPFCFQNHDIYPPWTFGSNPDSGGAGLVQAPPRTLLYLGHGTRESTLLPPHPWRSRGACKCFLGDPIPFWLPSGGRNGHDHRPL